MITVNINIEECKLKVTGHSESAPKGQDIICASVSMLVYMVAQYFQLMYNDHRLKRKPQIELEEGNSEVIAKPKTEYKAEAMQTMLVASVGFDLLARNFSEYVTVVKA